MSYQTFSAKAEAEFIEKGSRFIGLAYPCKSIEEFQTAKRDLEDLYQDANHITFAYRIKDGDTIHVRSSDDGEPSGTAGKPILNHIDGNKLLNTVIFVVRYFGGIKLGAGGLVRAYSNGARLVLGKADIIEYVETEIIEFEISYDKQRQLEYDLERFEKSQIIDREFSDKLRYKIAIAKDKKEELLARLQIKPSEKKKD